MPQQHVLHIRECQQSSQEEIIVKTYLVDRKIVGGAPISVHPVEQFGRQRVGFHGLIPSVQALGSTMRHADFSRLDSNMQIRAPTTPGLTVGYFPDTPGNGMMRTLEATLLNRLMVAGNHLGVCPSRVAGLYRKPADCASPELLH